MGYHSKSMSQSPDSSMVCSVVTESDREPLETVKVISYLAPTLKRSLEIFRIL